MEIIIKPPIQTIILTEIKRHNSLVKLWKNTSKQLSQCTMFNSER